MPLLIFLMIISACMGVQLQPDIIDGYELHMGETVPVEYTLNMTKENITFVRVSSDDADVLEILHENINDTAQQSEGIIKGVFHLQAVFIGVTHIRVTAHYGTQHKQDLLVRKVIVVRQQRPIDKAFTVSVAILVSLIYINFGCALDWGELVSILKRPVGPCIGLVGQFLVMPLLSYGIGLLLFPDRPDMRLGLLFTGVSPAGGASNIWTCVLDGNIDLSVTMTTVSTVAAFGLMPLWLFTLGPHVFKEAHLAVPYTHIASLAAALVVPLGIGYLIKKCLPRLSALLVRILKGFSALLILFIIIFASITNAYLFSLFTWRIAIGGLALPFLGYIFGWILALAARQPRENCLAIAVETGVQNTGIAIFLLRFSLPQPQADLTTVVPVAIAVMTPVPLLILYIVKHVVLKRSHKIISSPANTSVTELTHI